MNQNPSDNHCVCCGEYAVRGSWLCWKCQQDVTNTKVVKDHFVEKYLKTIKSLDKSNKV